MQTIHVYAQPSQHEPSYLIGTPEGLKQVGEAALSLSKKVLPEISSLRCRSSDGEAYDVEIISLPEGSRYWDNLKLPYTDYEYSAQGIHPNRLAIELIKQGAGEADSSAATPQEMPESLSANSSEIAKLKDSIFYWQSQLQEAITATISNDPEDYEQVKNALESLKLILEIKKLIGLT
jgi:hypothetical protein